jgi:hypothetical protein
MRSGCWRWRGEGKGQRRPRCRRSKSVLLGELIEAVVSKAYRRVNVRRREVPLPAFSYLFRQISTALAPAGPIFAGRSRPCLPPTPRTTRSTDLRPSRRPRAPYQGLVALHEAFDRLAEHHPNKAELVKLRYFAGRTADQARAALWVSPSAANRHWAGPTPAPRPRARLRPERGMDMLVSPPSITDRKAL